MTFIDKPGFCDTNVEKTDQDHFTKKCKYLAKQSVSTIMICCSNGAIDGIVQKCMSYAYAMYGV